MYILYIWTQTHIGGGYNFQRWRGVHTRSASESSSWPIRLLFFLQRATLPSMKSKNRPKGMKASAAQRFPSADGGPRQYRMDEKTDMMPQNPI